MDRASREDTEEMLKRLFQEAMDVEARMMDRREDRPN
jgi:hypothetical protein